MNPLRVNRDIVSFIVDDENLGTSEGDWSTSSDLRALPPLSPITAARIVVVAPHPDDEVFGAGGLIQRCRSQDVTVHVLAVTDGEGSHPRAAVSRRHELARRRLEESTEALGRLGCDQSTVERLRLPDGAVGDHRGELRERLMSTLRPGDWCVAPWSRDGHPDHDACGDVATSVGSAMGVRTLQYLVWAWHWATPDSTAIPWQSCRRLELSRRERARKRWATAAFTSQVRPLGPRPGEEAILPPPVVRRFWRPFEVFLEDEEV
jgi:LmbE family N-acetylglucosaminyl deacetylase